MWNWYHFNWLSGDQTAQQLIHSLDKASWALGDRAPRFVYGVGGRQNMYDLTHVALFDAIRAGRPINDGPWMCRSSALAIACQMAAYSGQLVTWDDVMNSQRSFALPCYGWDVEPPVQPGPDGRYPTALQGNAQYEQWLI
jgi:hypothetical protein